MSRTVGYVAGQKVDRLVDSGMLDREHQRQLQKFIEDLEMAVFSANREIIGRVIPELNRDAFMRMALVVAEARAHYVKLALEVSATGHQPPQRDLERLHQARFAFEELLHGYEAAQRLIERGYTNIGR
ncbi:MAG: hypothetical protein OHK0024_12010 [Thalassobaculales bacterium]